MAGVFISYRRSDTAPYASRLKAHLDAAFGAEFVFMDVNSLRPGEPFKDVIEATITSIDVVLALIGHDWLTVTDASGKRRLENPGDFVRLELATAFQFDRVVIPVLLENASMPASGELPEPLVALAQRHAITMGDTGWDGDVERLVRRLEEVVDTIPPCPYPGMVPYGRKDAARFFGRQREVTEIRDRLASQRLLCLVGPSGCGKSSLLEAGVLADLENKDPVHWAVRTMRPGPSPVRALGEALETELDGASTAEAVARAARQAIPGGEAGRLLLVVDQLEELFAQAGSDEQERFVVALEAIHDLDGVSIVLAIRADFYGELMESASLAARRRRQGRRAAAHRRRSRRGDRGAGEVEPCDARAGPARAPRRRRRQRAGCAAAPPGGARPPVGDDAPAPDLPRSLREHRGRRPRRPLCRRRRHGRRGARDALTRRGADRQARAPPPGPVRAGPARYAPPAPVRRPP